MPAVTKDSGAEHFVLRELNRSLVVDVVKSNSPISRAGIARATSLAKPTVSAIVDELIGAGVVRELGIGETTAGGGRPPVLLEYDSRSHLVAGVHVGVHTTTVVVADGRGAEIARTQQPTGSGRPQQTLARIAAQVEATFAATGEPRDRFAAVGVTVPGLVEISTGTCLLAPNLGWKRVPVGPKLYEHLGVASFVHNTAQATAVAERQEGAGKGAEEVVLFYAGSGVGAGVISKGRLQHGAVGITGEIGHCAVPGATGACRCGKTGCLETLAGSTALVAAAEALAARRPRSALGGARGLITPELVGELAHAGDAACVDLLTGIGTTLGVAASWMVNLFNPQVLVIAGGLRDIGEPLLGAFTEAVRAHSLPQLAERVDVRASSLGQDADVRGAVLLALQHSETYYRVVFQS